MKQFYFLITFLLTIQLAAQDLQSPSEFLGYELGSEFTPHHRVVDYYQYLAENAPDRMQLQQYGTTYEGRPLLLATISSAANMSRLDEIKEKHIQSTSGSGDADKAVVWLSYNVHGNESVSTEASLKTIHHLLTRRAELLENTIVLMDPCINPDGRDRYVHWYKQHRNHPYQVDPNSMEHHEGWQSGRSNHYMFDLNRDWAWLTQVESQQRLKQYNQWMPHVHVDFHEQGVDSPYYFAPAAEPYHEVITDFQRDFQEVIGRNHARYFDANGWFYFTKEVFDLFYPSYGDTYPTYNGSIGMTYEQGGSGRAGLGILTSEGDTLTLKDRIAHHFTTGISTVEVAADRAMELNNAFRKFYGAKDFKYKSYVLSGDEDKLEALTQLLDKHEIEYGRGNGSRVSGYDFWKTGPASATASENSLVVSTDQKRGTMVKVLFEPEAKLVDSLTYDITAWSLPYAYGLRTIASEKKVLSQPYQPAKPITSTSSDAPFAYVTDWDSMKDARFLTALMKAGITVRTTDRPFQLDGRSFAQGSLIITSSDHRHAMDTFKNLPQQAREYGKSLHAVGTGFVDSGKDFGSSSVRMIHPPKVGVLAGKPTSTLRFGEVWHYFEQQLEYPLTVLHTDYWERVDLSDYDVLVLPGGYAYGSSFGEKQWKRISEWVSKGGRLVAMGDAITSMAKSGQFKIKSRTTGGEEEKSPDLTAHAATERQAISSAITGAIFKTTVDPTHPLAYGYGDTYHSLKLGSARYELLDGGNVAYIGNETKPVSGFAGSKAQMDRENTLVFGTERKGRGTIVYMADNPLFRGFWENGKLFFANAIFMIP